jgi:hypothetical protein
MSQQQPQKKPYIGGAGLTLISLGIVFMCSGVSEVRGPAMALIAIGGIVVIIALFTGDIKLLG